VLDCAEALDEYFSRADVEKYTITAEKSAKIALSKHDKVRLDHERRINALQQAQDSSLQMVSLHERCCSSLLIGALWHH
jgi:hypothetical protein